MIVPDANLLIYAYSSTSPSHRAARRWWEDALSGHEPVGIPWIVVLAFVRLISHPTLLERMSCRAVFLRVCGDQRVSSQVAAQPGFIGERKESLLKLFPGGPASAHDRNPTTGARMLLPRGQ